LFSQPYNPCRLHPITNEVVNAYSASHKL